MKTKEETIDEARILINRLISEGYSNYKIAKDTGISEKTIGNYVRKINKPSYTNAKVLLQSYANEGSMLKENKPKWNEVTPVSEGDYMMVEYVDLRASAGRLGVGDVTLLPETHKRLVPKEFSNGKFLVVGIDGDSMNDGTSRSLNDGDEVLIYQHEGGILDPLPIRKTLFVITTRDGNVLKQIKEINEEEKYILCHSFNPKYEDFKIPFDDIYQIFIVCKIVQKQISLI